MHTICARILCSTVAFSWVSRFLSDYDSVLSFVLLLFSVVSLSVGFHFGPSMLRAPAEQTKVATILGTFFFLLLPPLFKTTEGVVVLFQIFAWAPEKK